MRNVTAWQTGPGEISKYDHPSMQKRVAWTGAGQWEGGSTLHRAGWFRPQMKIARAPWALQSHRFYINRDPRRHSSWYVALRNCWKQKSEWKYMLHFYCIRPFHMHFTHNSILLLSEYETKCRLWIILMKDKQSLRSLSPPQMIFPWGLNQAECAAKGTDAVLGGERSINFRITQVTISPSAEKAHIRTWKLKPNKVPLSEIWTFFFHQMCHYIFRGVCYSSGRARLTEKESLQIPLLGSIQFPSSRVSLLMTISFIVVIRDSASFNHLQHDNHTYLYLFDLQQLTRC